MAAAASPAHQGRLAVIAALASGLLILGYILTKKYLKSRNKHVDAEEKDVQEEESVAVEEESSTTEKAVSPSLAVQLTAVSEAEHLESKEPEAEVSTLPANTLSSSLVIHLQTESNSSPTEVSEPITSTEVKTEQSAPPISQPAAAEVIPDSHQEEEPEEAAVEEDPKTDEQVEETTQESSAQDVGESTELVSESASQEEESPKVTSTRLDEFKLDPEAVPFTPRNSALIHQFVGPENSILSEIVASGMGGESLAEPLEKLSDSEDLPREETDMPQVSDESLPSDIVDLSKAEDTMVDAPKSSVFVGENQPVSGGSDFAVVDTAQSILDTDQANNNSISRQSSSGDSQPPVGQYDDAEEGQKNVEHDMNSDSSFDFFDLATSPNDFKPAFDFVDPNENLSGKHSAADENQEVIDKDRETDGTDYIPEVPQMEAEEEEEKKKEEYSREDITTALDAALNSSDSIGTRQLEILASLMLSKDFDIQQTAMTGVIKCAAFTDNQNSLRELGCLQKLTILLKSYVISLKVGHNVLPTLISSVANAISNMSVNEKNQTVLKDSVPLLVDLTLDGHMKESALLATLRALTNLSTTERHHGQYTRLVQHLYQLMDAGSMPVKLQALKVLVNLSCSAEMVQHLLAAKAPESLLGLLHQDVEEALVLRWTTLLANIVHTVREHKLTQSSLPCPEKAASPETMYTAVYGVHMIGDLKSKVFLLSKHKNEDIRYQAARVYSGLMQ